MIFEEWLEAKGLSKKTTRNYSTALKHKSIVPLLTLISQPTFDARQLSSNPSFENFCRKFDHTGSLFKMNKLGHDMYRCALLKFAEFSKTTTAKRPKFPFPEGLQDWAGHRNGGVRRPFDKASGRPTGGQIETPLTRRLSEWASGLISGKNVPRTILLVGGPGNGKTDAVEQCIAFLDKELRAGERFFNKFSSQFKNAHASPPRRVEARFSEFVSKGDRLQNSTISIVQDATERDSSQKKRPEEILLEEFADISSSQSTSIYIACVNRGILAKTLELAEKSDPTDGTLDLINHVIECVTLDANKQQCWPIAINSNIAVWPMDVESLLDPRITIEGETVGHKIFKAALKTEFWKEPCKLGEKCPYCQNRILLEQPDALDNLIKLLFFFELSSGKRWTFRDLFSLVAYLLAGTPSELEVAGRRRSPCEWSELQVNAMVNRPTGSPERDRAPYLLMSRLYHHRLFPLWPSLTKGDHRKAKDALNLRTIDQDLAYGLGLLKFTRDSAKATNSIVGDIPKLIANKFSTYLDPALLSGNELLPIDDLDMTFSNLEDLFSLSIKEGVDCIKNHVHPLEQHLLSNLANADYALSDLKKSGISAKSAGLLQRSLKRFSIRLVKRSMGTRHGISKNKHLFQSYSMVINADPKELNNARKGLRKILHGGSTSFRAELTTTFGQPVAKAEKQIRLNINTAISVRPEPIISDDQYPKSYLPFLSIENHFIPITFDLFEALTAIDNGLLTASLHPEVYSLLDRVTALVSGRVVRDKTILFDDPVITFGTSNDSVELINNEFVYSQGSST